MRYLCAMLRLLLLSVALVVGTVVRAQRQITVLHSDTDEPIMGVTVRVGGTVLKTDRHGRVTIPEQFDSISFSHVEFVHECLRPSELTDPMYLFPRSHQLKEVTVAGIGPDLRRSLAERSSPFVAAELRPWQPFRPSQPPRPQADETHPGGVQGVRRKAVAPCGGMTISKCAGTEWPSRCADTSVRR